MTDTVTTQAPEAVLPDGLRGLDSEAVVDLILDRRRAADRAEAELLAGVVHYVDLHPVVGELDEPAVEVLPASGPVGLLPPMLMPVSSAGVPEVTQDAAAALAAALGITYGSVCALIGDAVELAYRLPRLWALVQGGRLQAWRARRVAQHTRTLPPAAAGYVDRHVAVTGARNQIPVNLGAVAHQALSHCDPDLADGHEHAALEDRHVTFHYGQATVPCASADLTATLDVLDALDLDHRISDLAGHLRRLGDTSPVGVRRAHGLGLLANPQHALPLFHHSPSHDNHTDPAEPETTTATRAVSGDPWGARQNAVAATLYVHVTTDDLTAAAAGKRGRTGRVEKLGPASLTLLGDWLRRTSGVTIRPVLDPPASTPSTPTTHPRRCAWR